MKNKLIVRLSNNLGNQMFMYASAYVFAKKLNRDFFYDDETAYQSSNLYKYNLDIFKISSTKAPNNLKFLNKSGYIKRKFLKYFDNFYSSKMFYVEPRDRNKNTSFNDKILSGNFRDKLFVEGHFESEKYFNSHINEIKSEFSFKNYKSFENNQIFNSIKNSESVSICIRQNRFSERKRAITIKDEENSLIFTEDQVKYIEKSMNIIKSKVTKPKFFLWSNDLKKLNNYFPDIQFTSVSTNKVDFDIFLMSQTKHSIVIPSSFNWWGAWLGKSSKSIVIRPTNDHFSNFNIKSFIRNMAYFFNIYTRLRIYLKFF